MALTKTAVPISFLKGLNQKIDPKQVPIGNFKSLINGTFNKVGLLQKRNGYTELASASVTAGVISTVSPNPYSSLTTYSESLVALGNTLNIFSEEQNEWLNKGVVNQVSLSTLSMVRSSTGQSSVDAYVAQSGLSIESWVDSDGNSKYQVNDSSNGQILLNAVNLPSGAMVPRSFAMSTRFIVTYLITQAGTPKLQYVSIPYANLSLPTAPANLSVAVKSNTTGYDAVMYNDNLYFAWNGSDVGGAIRFSSINHNLVQAPTEIISGHSGDLITIASNSVNSNMGITYWNSAGSQAFTSILTSAGVTVLAPTSVLTATVITRITSIFQNGILNIFYEVFNNYPSGIPSHYTEYNTITTAGVVTAPVIILRSVGLASKPFIQNNTIYVMLAYNGELQPTYFVSDELGNIQVKLAYSNGGGYPSTQILTNASFTSAGYTYLGYQYKDLLVSANNLNNSNNTTNIYTQTGVNTVTINFNFPAYSTEIGSNLNLTGGIVTAYDGNLPTEQNFHLFPEDITVTPSSAGGFMSDQQYFYQVCYEWTDSQSNLFRSAPSIPVTTTVIPGATLTFTSVFAINVTSITVSSSTGLSIGQTITDSTTVGNIQPGTYITSITGNVLGLSLPTIGASAGGGDTLETSDFGSVTLVIPTLRITAKPEVRIVIYRWSVANQIYYQVTSITSPLLNNTTVDTVTYVDTLNDNAIIGNTLLYTTGGVVEDIAPPSTQIMTLYKSRLFLLDAEDTNLLWYSKQVIENTPVEFSDLFTIYVAPTTGASKSTGPVTALGAMDDKLIIFKKDAAYYLTGNGPDNTGANNDFSDPTFIAGTVGCANQNSIVLIPTGLMFQSDKGIWLLDRNLGTTYIGSSVEDDTTGSLVMSAITIPGTNQVRFTMDSGVTLMYDYYVSQWGTFNGIPGVSSVVYNSLHTYLRSDSSVFQETPGLYLDGSIPTCMSFTTTWFNIAGLQGYQRGYQYYLLGSYVSPHLLQVTTAYDYDSNATQSNIISPDNFSPAWGDDTTWGNITPWGGPSPNEQWRVDLTQQKCQSIQITVTEIYDPSFGIPAGAGFTMSGLNLIMGAKSQYPRLPPTRIVGGT